jgi:hypothetical protein
MIKYSKAELIDMIDNYSDTSAIIGQLREVKVELDELECSDDKLYFLQEAIENLGGMFELLMDIKKDHLTNADLQTPQD